ncbi:MAG: DinB family protein [Chloroflexi bacterium]|nr:DinB family protein [Chloroflexota bacterium]
MASTVAEYKTNIAAAYEAYMAELKQAGANWETKPAHGEGEEAWSARQVGEHVAGAATFFGAGLAQYLGLQGPERAQPSFATAAEATTGMAAAYAKFLAVVDQITDDKLALEFDVPRLGKQTVGGILGIQAYHLNDHAGQLKKLRG